MKNDSTDEKGSSAHKRRFNQYLLAGILAVKLRVCRIFGRFNEYFLAAVLGAVILFFLHWGIWHSLPYRLTGVEFPIKKVYRTDTSNRGRELGFWIEVYQLPEHLQDLLLEKKIDLKDYPRFSSLKWDGYTRITWTHEFPGNDAEKSIYDSIKKDIDPTRMPTVERVSDDESAKELAGHLFQHHGTLYGGWYKSHVYENEVFVTDYFFYIINIEKRTLIMFGRDT